ncbi:hypothetical protein JNW89_25010, partial [Micromonospora sp. 4G55]|nr:hypothetical protein [Micromonospora sp. 4G55]
MFVNGLGILAAVPALPTATPATRAEAAPAVTTPASPPATVTATPTGPAA